MRNFMVDINKCQNFFNEKVNSNDIKIWRCSNENIYDVLSTTNAKDKDVLTVLSSGDQAFHFLNRGAKSVDTFDINSLTFYYFHLRKWLICYFSYYYPPRKFDINFVKNLLKVVSIKNSDDISAYYFWKIFINRFSSKELREMFYLFDSKDDEIFDLCVIKNRLNNEKIRFYNIDLRNDVNMNKKYDIIYTSNIIDYVPQEKIVVYRDNIEKLLKKNGIFITTLINSCKLKNSIVSIFDEKFALYDNRATDKASSYIYEKRK